MRDLCFDLFKPRFKCGAEVGLGVGALASGVIGSQISANSSANIASQQLRFQRKENQLNRDWQTDEAEKARQFDFAERVASQAFQKEMVDYQNAYNDPSAQAQRYQSASLNPQIMLGGNGTQQLSASPSSTHAASSPMPGSVGGISPYPQQPLDLQIPSLIGSVANAFKSISDARKTGVETDWLEKSMDLSLRKLSSESSLNEVTKAGIELDNALKTQKFPSEVKKAISEAWQSCYDAIVSYQTIGKVQNETALIESQKNLNDALTKLHGTQEQLVALDVSTYFNRLNSALKLQQAQTAESYAGAEEAKAGAALKREQRFSVELDNDFNEASFQSRVIQIMNEAKASEKLPEQVENQIRLQLKDLDWADAEHRAGIVAKIIGSLGAAVGAAAGAFVGVKGLKLKGRSLDLKENKAPAVYNYNRTSQSYERSFPGGVR